VRITHKPAVRTVHRTTCAFHALALTAYRVWCAYSIQHWSAIGRRVAYITGGFRSRDVSIAALAGLPLLVCVTMRTFTRRRQLGSDTNRQQTRFMLRSHSRFYCCV